MKKRRFTRQILPFLSVLCAVWLLSGCGKGAALSCTLSIASEDAMILSETEIGFNEGETVLDILKKATRDAGIQMEYTGVGAASYVAGIDNLYEFDRGPESGWLYSVNGEDLSEGAGTYKPAAGDAIAWRYVLQVQRP